MKNLQTLVILLLGISYTNARVFQQHLQQQQLQQRRKLQIAIQSDHRDATATREFMGLRRLKAQPYGPFMNNGASGAAAPTTEQPPIGSVETPTASVTAPPTPTSTPTPAPTLTPTFGPTPTLTPTLGPTPAPLPNITSSLPDFAYLGGPPDARGSWSTDSYLNLQDDSGFVSTLYLSNGDFVQQMGRFLNWQCTDKKGGYISKMLRTDTYSNGTVITAEYCEVGEVLIEQGIYRWNNSATYCPDPNNTVYTVPNTRVPFSRLPAPTNYTCTGVAGSGRNTQGGPGLVRRFASPGITRGPALPPPLSPNTSFPPVFSSPGGPADLSGVYFSDAMTTGELATGNGTASSIQLLDDGTFTSVFIRFNSYNCTGSPGSYESSISYTQTFQNLTRASGEGCSSGTVDLTTEVYGWSPAENGQCPPVGGEPALIMKRVRDSPRLPTATANTCAA